MKILLTGHNGFVGRHISKALRDDAHTVIGIEAEPQFDHWVGKFTRSLKYDVALQKIDAVVHAGAISSNQYTVPDIFIWNSYASLILAKYVRDRYGQIPFVFFSSFQVSASENDWHKRSWYAWSKVFAEDCIRAVLPGATILRPSVMWGDEKAKQVGCSVPYQLATHQLTHLYTNWGRDYVHVSDAVEAVKIGIHDAPAGTFSLDGEYWRNEQLAELTDWNRYQLVENPQAALGVAFNNSQYEGQDSRMRLPGWERKADLKTEFKRIENATGCDEKDWGPSPDFTR